MAILRGDQKAIDADKKKKKGMKIFMGVLNNPICRVLPCGRKKRDKV